MPKQEIEFTPSLSFPQHADSKPELSRRILSSDQETGDKTELLIHAPGTRWGEPVCKHTYWEECYIVEGRLYDQTLDKWFGAGDYCCRPPGMLHGPFQSDETHGVRLLCFIRYPSEAVWNPPNDHSGFSTESRTSFNLSRHARTQSGNPNAHGVFEHRALPGPYTVYGAQ